MFRGLAALFFITACCTAPLAAQSAAGRLSGRVLDPSGALVADAVVVARQLDSGRESRTATDAEGRYRYSWLLVGEYELVAKADNFVGRPRRARVEVGATHEADLELLLAVERASVDVAEASPSLEPDSAAVGSFVSRATLAELPLNQREFLDLALLAGGVHSAAAGSELARQNRSGLHVSGSREATNNFMLDGVDNNDLYINRLVVSPPLDSVREFRLHSANYQAEFGRSSGAQVNVVSRSGSNQLHGSIYDYFRNEALDARNFFDPAGQDIPKFRRNQFGVSGGGPLRRNRTFFFGGYEGTRVRGAPTRTARVPTVLERSGDFSALGRPIIDPFTQQPFPNNRIPVERMDPAGRALADYYPLPNRDDPNQNLVSTPGGDALINQYYGRLDHSFSDRDAFYVRYNLSHDRSLDPFSEGVTNVPGFGSFVLNRGQNLAISETRIISPATLLEARFGFNRLRREVTHQNQGHDFAAELGIPGLSTDPLLTGFPAVNVGGFDSLGDNTALPILRGDNTYQASAALSVIRGSHAFKFGGDFRAVSVDGLQGLFARGQLNFLGALTTYSVSDLLLGFPTFTIQTAVDNPFRQRSQSWSGFVQDDWRLASNLTLNLGLRYEYNRPAYDADDRFQYFDLQSQELVPAGTGRLGRAGYRDDRNNFAPRLGLAWSPRPGDLVVRAGYGVYHNLAILEANSGLYFNPPYFDLRLFFPSERQLLTLEDPFPAGAGFTPPASVNSLQPDFRTGYSQHWNAGVEKALPASFLLRLSYVGTKGTKLLRRRDINQPAPGEGDVNPRRPIAGFANVVLFESAASSTYHSGIVSLERRFVSGFSFSGAATWAKSIDDVSALLGSDGDQAFPQNSHDFRAERGLSNFNQARRFVFSAAYELPFQNVLARNWRLYSIGSFGSGRPLTPSLSFDNSNTGNTGSIFGADRPDAIGDPAAGSATPERFFNTDAFAVPGALQFGNAGRNSITGPSFASLDVAVKRNFRLGERATIDFLAEAFNVANRANFGLPQRVADEPTFGRILSAGAARQIQFGLRLSF